MGEIEEGRKTHPRSPRHTHTHRRGGNYLLVEEEEEVVVL
jgi:hypothetical protein